MNGERERDKKEQWCCVYCALINVFVQQMALKGTIKNYWFFNVIALKLVSSNYNKYFLFFLLSICVCVCRGSENILENLLSRTEYACNLEEIVSERTTELQEEKKWAQQVLPR